MDRGSEPAGSAMGNPATDEAPRVDSSAVVDPWATAASRSEGHFRADNWWGPAQKGDFSEPPAWAGWNNYRLWRRALFRWDSNTDVSLHRRAEKILKNMDWELQAKLEHISEEQLSSKGYLQAIMSVLDVLAGERDDSEKRRSIRAALYEGSRRSDESLAQYTLRRESQFTTAAQHLPLSDELRAFMLEEQAGLSKQGLQNLRVLTEGRHEFAKVKKALHVLDTEEESLFKSSKGNFLAASAASDGEVTDDDDTGMTSTWTFLWSSPTRT